MTDAKDALAALKKKTPAVSEDGEILGQDSPVPIPEPEVHTTTPQTPVAPLGSQVVNQAEPELKDSSIKEYQQYSSARISTCMVTPGGIRINFTDYTYYTKNEEVMEYLDKAIDDGCKAITKGVRVSADEINPAAAAKRKIIEEFKKSQEGRDFSGQGVMAAKAAAGLAGGAGTGVVTSDGVAN